MAAWILILGFQVGLLSLDALSKLITLKSNRKKDGRVMVRQENTRVELTHLVMNFLYSHFSGPHVSALRSKILQHQPCQH
jgi:hypothetical protein